VSNKTFVGIVDVLDTDFQRHIVEVEGPHGYSVLEISDDDVEFFELEAGVEVEVTPNDNNVTCSIVRVLADDQLF
jgi:hypothetical protein